MKKGIRVLFISLFVILISGCDNDKVITKTCTLTNNQSASGYKLDSNYEIHSTNGYVTSVTTKEVVTSDNKQIRDYFKKTLETTYSNANKTYGGYTYNITDEDNKVTSDVTIDYSKMDLDKFVKDNAQMKAYVNKKNQITLEGIQKVYETLGATCK